MDTDPAQATDQGSDRPASGRRPTTVLAPFTVSHTFRVPATREAVWQRLVVTAAYADWNPQLRHIDGPFIVGTTRKLSYVAAFPGAPHVFACHISVVEPGHRLRWRGPVGAARHLVRADHGFTLRDGPAPETTEVTHDEHFSGWLLRLIWPVLRRTVGHSHAEVNAALVASFGRSAADR